MANYVLADIHGDGKRFHEMLEKIGFSQEDVLYILGDVIDRGDDGIALLTQIMEMPNVRMMLGNHEDMMLKCLGEEPDEKRMTSWIRNGGSGTVRAFRKLRKNRQKNLLQWLGMQPTRQEICVNGQTFYLVHGWPDEQDYNRLWGRPENLDARSALVSDGVKVIIGHTPVALLEYPTVRAQKAYFRMLEQTGEHMRILHAPHYIDIDCGCSQSVPGARLACLRLEDMCEFYV